MPTYCYECPDCEGRQEHHLSISSRKEEMPCECGGTAAQLYNWEGTTLVRGNQKPFALDSQCVPIGWDRGNTDCDKQERRYAKIIEGNRKRAKQNDKAAIKGGIRHIASVPRELHRMRSNQFGKEHLDPTRNTAAELKQKLREDGQLFVD